MMKHIRLVTVLPFLLLLLIITACGGGGGGTGSTSTTSTTGTIVGPVVSVRVEAVLNGTSTIIDPTNIFVNEVVKFQLTGVDSGQLSQPRVVLPVSNWAMVGSPGGTLASSGLFNASATPTGNFASATASYDGTTYTTSVRVVDPLAVIKGKGRLRNGLPTPNVQIVALDAGGNTVATGLVGADGSIRMSAPTTAVRFTSAFSNSYYVRQFAYNGFDYSTLITTCTAPLPSLTSGVTSNLLSDVVFYATSDTSPPPPPDGCQ